MAFVKDSAITTKIKTKLAADHPTSLALVHVDTDKDGVVWLTVPPEVRMTLSRR
jgi:hyperosmotically inducible protein